jgi:DNA-binding CsgD family transcriptional regulator
MSERGEVNVSRFQIGGVAFVVASRDVRSPLGRYGLTPAEEAVCRLVLEGKSNGEVAELRGTSTRTVANQLQSVYIKVGVRGRRELAAALGAG